MADSYTAGSAAIFENGMLPTLCQCSDNFACRDLASVPLTLYIDTYQLAEAVLTHLTMTVCTVKEKALGLQRDGLLDCRLQRIHCKSIHAIVLQCRRGHLYLFPPKTPLLPPGPHNLQSLRQTGTGQSSRPAQTV